MSYDKIQLANEALSHLKANKISSFEDGSNESDIVRTHYDTFIAQVFSSYYWGFAQKTHALSRDVSPAVEEKTRLYYKHAFIVPADCKFIRGIYLPHRNLPYKLWTREGDHILSNAEELIARYMTYPVEYSWPGYFRAYAAYMLASLIAEDITGDPTAADRMRVMADGGPQIGHKAGLWHIAANRDAMEYPAQEEAANELIVTRFY